MCPQHTDTLFKCLGSPPVCPLPCLLTCQDRPVNNTELWAVPLLPIAGLSGSSHERACIRLPCKVLVPLLTYTGCTRAVTCLGLSDLPRYCSRRRAVLCRETEALPKRISKRTEIFSDRMHLLFVIVCLCTWYDTCT